MSNEKQPVSGIYDLTGNARWEAEQKRWLSDPFTSGVVVRHKASSLLMVVIKKADYPRDRTCAWLADNRRRQDDFYLCELERADAALSEGLPTADKPDHISRP